MKRRRGRYGGVLVLEQRGEHAEEEGVVELGREVEVHEGTELGLLPYGQVLQRADVERGGVEATDEVI